MAKARKNGAWRNQGGPRAAKLRGELTSPPGVVEEEEVESTKREERKG